MGTNVSPCLRRRPRAVDQMRHRHEERAPLEAAGEPLGRGLHSLTSQLNLSAFSRIEGARRGCVARVRGVLGGV